MFHISSKLIFLLGFTIGVILAILLQILSKNNNVPVEKAQIFSDDYYKNWLNSQQLRRKQIEFDEIRYSNKTFQLESDFLYKKIDILCVILVRNEKNAKAAVNTWAKGCNNVMLINLKKSNKIVIPRKKEDSSWNILCNTLLNMPTYSWVIVVYDYTFVILENLRRCVAALNPDDKYYFGHAVQFWNTIYNMGQAGYVLSRGSIMELKKSINNSETCYKGLTYRNQEDYYLGKYLYSLDIKPCDTRDKNGLSTFQPYNLYHVFFPGKNYYQFSVYPVNCCSSQTIAFQSIEGDKMYTYYYLLYNVQLFNTGKYGNKPPLTSASDDEAWKVFLRKHGKYLNISKEEYYNIWVDLVGDPYAFGKTIRSQVLEN